MADLTAYKNQMEYLAREAPRGNVHSNNSYYLQLKEAARYLPELASWLARNVDPYVNQL